MEAFTKFFDYLAWRWRVSGNRRRHADILDEMVRGVMTSEGAINTMMLRDRAEWHKNRKKGIVAPYPDRFDYTTRVPYRFVVARQKEREAELERIRDGRE